MNMMRTIYAADSVQRNLNGHKILGLAVAAVLYLICLSGTVTVFYPDMERWETTGIPDIAQASSQAVAAAVMDARAHAPTPKTEIGAGLPTSVYPRLVVTLNEDHRAYDAQGRFVGPANHPIIESMTSMHYYLHLPETLGLIVVGLGGLVMVTLIVGGILAHPRIFKDAFLWRWVSGVRLARTDLHNRIGVWGLPFHLAIVVTGALIGLGNVFILTVALAFHGGDTVRAAEPLYGAPVVSAAPGRVGAAAIARALDTVRERGVPSYLSINNPGTPRESLSIGIEAPDRLAYGEGYEFDNQGRLKREHHLLDGAVGKQIYASLYKLHFGSFGGIWVQWAYTLLGLGLCLVCTTGMDIWLLKSAQRGRPHPRLQGAWTGFVWGAPIAMTAAALFTLLAGDVFKPVFWGLLVALTLLGTRLANTVPLARWGRWTLVCALVALVAAHAAVFGGAAMAGVALSVNAALLLTALAFLLPDLRRFRAQA